MRRAVCAVPLRLRSVATWRRATWMTGARPNSSPLPNATRNVDAKIRRSGENCHASAVAGRKVSMMRPKYTQTSQPPAPPTAAMNTLSVMS